MLTFARFVLARQGLDLDESGWFQMLVFVVMAVIYGLASIIKAKSAKPSTPSRNAQQSHPTTSPDDPHAALQPPPASPQANARPPRGLSSPSPSHQFASAQPSSAKPRPQPRLATAHQKIDHTSPPDQFTEPSFPISTLTPETQQSVPSAGDLFAPEDLPTAILHSEILNTPLALRDPLERPFTDM